MGENAKLYIAAILATAAALRADIGTPPLPDDARAAVAWVLSGIIAGLTVIVGPHILDALRSKTP